MDLVFSPTGTKESVCLQCSPGTAGNGKECRGKEHRILVVKL